MPALAPRSAPCTRSTCSATAQFCFLEVNLHEANASKPTAPRGPRNPGAWLPSHPHADRATVPPASGRVEGVHCCLAAHLTWRSAPAQHASHAASAHARHRRHLSGCITHPTNHALMPALPATAGAATTFARPGATRARAWTAQRRSCITSTRRVVFGGSISEGGDRSSHAVRVEEAGACDRQHKAGCAPFTSCTRGPSFLYGISHSVFDLVQLKRMLRGGCFVYWGYMPGSGRRTKRGDACWAPCRGIIRARRPSTRRTHTHTRTDTTEGSRVRVRVHASVSVPCSATAAPALPFGCRAASTTAESEARTSIRVPRFLPAAGACSAKGRRCAPCTLLVVAVQLRPRIRPR